MSALWPRTEETPRTTVPRVERHRVLLGLVVALVLAAGLCVLDDDHAGIDLCFMALAVTLQTWGLVSLTPMGRVVPCAMPRAAGVVPRPPRPPI